MPIAYVGHAEGWERIEVDGSLDGKDCAVSFRGRGQTLAVATINRDRQSLAFEAAMQLQGS